LNILRLKSETQGEDKPNKKFYDPRVWVRKGEETFVKRLTQAFED
jgi:fructose-bisphosphate aldolase class II